MKKACSVLSLLLLFVLTVSLCTASATVTSAGAKGSGGSASFVNDSEARFLIAQGILDHLQDKVGAPSLGDLQKAASLYPTYPRSINDSSGKTHVFYRPVERVIILNNNAADAMTVIGVDGLIVGVPESLKENSYQFPVTSTLPSIGKWNEPDIEAILALKPDLIISYITWPDPEKLERHLPPGIPVARMEFYKADIYRKEMEAAGHLFNREEKAGQYLDWYDSYVDLVKERVKDIPQEQRVRVYAEAGQGQAFGRRAYSNGTGLHDILVTAGGVNIASGHIKNYADVEQEWIVHQKPELVLIWSGKGGYKVDERDRVIALHSGFTGIRGFENIPAVRDGRVYVVTASFAYGSSTPVALVQVASWLYPDRFSDVLPEAIHREYLEKYTQTSEKVRDTATFFYPDGRR